MVDRTVDDGVKIGAHNRVLASTTGLRRLPFCRRRRGGGRPGGSFNQAAASARVQQSEWVRAGRFDPAMVAVFATVVCAAGAARPSLWFDEAATISGSTRSVPELWRLIHNVDAVHGLYYLVMHGWFAVFPATEFWSRLSSGLAVGAAAAGVRGHRLRGAPANHLGRASKPGRMR